MTLMGILDLYAAGKIKFSPATMDEYKSTMRRFDEFLGRPSVPADLTDDNALAFLRHRYETKSPATAAKDRRQLLAVWRWCYCKHHTEVLPRDVPSIHVPRKRVRAWHPGELESMLKSAKSMPLHRDWGDLEWRSIILVAYDSGERIGALLKTPVAGFDRKAKMLTVPASARKFGQRDHVSSLHETTVKAVVRMLNARRTKSDVLFSWWGSYESLRRHFVTLLESAGLDRRATKPFHGIRQSSFTSVFAEFGREEARTHCGHGHDLSAHYLDESMLSQLRPDVRRSDRIIRPAG